MSQSHILTNRRGAMAVLGMTGAATLAPAALAQRSTGSRMTLEQAIEAVRIAMVEGDGRVMDLLLHDRVNYMHSSGHSQTKQDLILEMAGKRFFASLTFSLQTVDVVGDVGVVVQTIDQVKNLPGGKTRASQIKVLQTWILSGHKWKLLTRSSHIISSPLVSACSPSGGSAG